MNEGMASPIIRRRRWVKVVLALYFAGFLICELLLLWGTYDSGVFQRQHTVGEWALGVGTHLIIAAIWPYSAVVFLLLYFGILPK
jgi:hypothetical protein